MDTALTLVALIIGSLALAYLLVRVTHYGEKR